ncbi:hypothetical protein GCM10010329_81920 [Streptomyces spiroverticillatus]|uniref:STAS domain-containing protein n=1 Tax=Streptomyces finlayi TaxID=67296 RepID=A0A918X8M0_9ACTN|nr:STAS domain-containing protein [Streptomyces finlayi]GHA46942.1 hypothetical protein GCM10010329_81920 [Streptomyces spiroverticillatus]GHD18297.1 hypothetical protein GCM10010334_81000 [Streptomyces finlayi]
MNVFLLLMPLPSLPAIRLPRSARRPYRVVTATGELDILTTPALHARLTHALNTHPAPHVVLDLTHVTFADITFLNMLCDAQRTARTHDGWLRLVYTHHTINKLLRAAGRTTEFPQYLTTHDAAHNHPTPH